MNTPILERSKLRGADPKGDWNSGKGMACDVKKPECPVRKQGVLHFPAVLCSLRLVMVAPTEEGGRQWLLQID
jgi:hypothetical protein